MFVYDVDGDGKADIISSSAHEFGIWYYLQKPPNKDGHPEFVKMDLFPKLVSETHAMHFVDINGDGLKDIVTGKRWWSHGRKGASPALKTQHRSTGLRRGAIRMVSPNHPTSNRRRFRYRYAIRRCRL